MPKTYGNMSVSFDFTMSPEETKLLNDLFWPEDGTADTYWTRALTGQNHFECKTTPRPTFGDPEERDTLVAAFENALRNNLFPMVPPGYYWKFRYVFPFDYLRRGHKDRTEYKRDETVGYMVLKRKSNYPFLPSEKVADCNVFAGRLTNSRCTEEMLMCAAGQALSHTDFVWKNHIKDPLMLASYGVPRYVKRLEQIHRDLDAMYNTPMA